MADTTIGYAVLQIIPSLKGVSEAIEKQIAGQVVEVKIEPKTDAAKVDKSVKDAVKKSKVEVELEPKVDSKKLDKSIEDAAKSGKPPEVHIEPKIDTKKLEQTIGDAAKKARDTKIEMPQIDTRGMGTKLRDAITGGLRELNNNPALKDIQEQLGKQVGAAIGQKIGEALGNSPLGKAAQEIAAQVQPLADKFGTLKTNIEGSATQLRGLTSDSGKIAGGLSAISGAAGPLAGVFTALTTFMPGFNDSLTKIQAGKGGWKDWLEIALPLANTIERVERSVINIARNPLPRLDTSLGALNLPRYTGPDTAPPGGWGARGEPLPAPPRAPNVTDTLPQLNLPLDTGGHAGGGTISGPGSGTSDSILARVSNGEYIVNANATRKNLPLLEVINSDKLPGFEGGGLVAGASALRNIISERFGISNIGGYRPGGDGFDEHSTGRALDVMVGNDRAKGDAVKDFALANASAIDLKWAIWRQHLYYPGGGGYDMADRGNPTANHMDHVHIFSGTGIVNGLLGALQGATGPTGAPGDGAKTLGGAAPAAASPISAAGSGGMGGSSVGSGGFSMPTSISGFATAPFDAMTAQGKAGSGPGHRDPMAYFPNAASAAIGGQINSALGAFGINGAPRWLGGISQLVGGISVGGSGGGGASPTSSLIPSASSFMPSPASMPFGGGGQQQPGGPQTVFNIQTARVEDAFVRADRLTKEKALSKLGQF